MAATAPDTQLATRDTDERTQPTAIAAADGVRRALATPLRVLIVSDCSSFRPPFTAGGTERQLSDLALQLARAGVEIAVVARDCPDWNAETAGSSRQEAPGAAALGPAPRTIYVTPAPVPKGLGWAALGPNLRYIFRTCRLLLQMRSDYDVLIVSGFRQLALPVSVAARLARKRCLLRIEAAWDLDDELTPESNARIGSAAKRLVSMLIRTSRRLAFRLADDVVALSDPLAARLEELGAAPAKVRQIPNGVDTEKFAPIGAAEKAALRARLGLPAGRPIYIYTGRICRAKGLLELLRVWERLAGRDDAYLLLVGSGAGSHESCEPEVRDMAARHPGSIEWRGEVQNVAQYLQASDVFVLLSYFEAFSLSMLEAVSVGLPCLVTDVGCARQVIQHHASGAIVPPRAATETILREFAWLQSRRDSWPAMGACGRSRVVSGYSLESIAVRYAQLCGDGKTGHVP